ncbi:unnamed protein product [Cladocopium goreaui]|uniref:Sensitivity to high expression protein 10 n=1 Tax=Cladocopium goreaui TaxID=2562237 RepID=A0A9P1CVL1_9DINO|nr:unnamed protein product [Cladocopium goreaui]
MAESEEADARDFGDIAADMPDEEEIVFDGPMKAAEAAALTSLMNNSSFLTRCSQRCGAEAVELAQQVYKKLGSSEHVGEAVEAVVTKYGAPHLRPTDIEGRSEQDTACWSLINLLKYAAACATQDEAKHA